MPQLQMPKLLKSLLPLREDKKGKQPSPLAHQARGPEATEQTVPGARAHGRPAQGPSQLPVATTWQTADGPDGPPSPLSEASSGYFSHSVSTATLSDASVPGLDAAAQTPGSPPLALRLVTPEELSPTPAVPCPDGSPAARMPVLAGSAEQSGGHLAPEASGVSSEKQEPAGASPTLPRPPAASLESPGQQNGGHVCSATPQLGRPKDPAKPAGSCEADASRAQRPPDPLPLSLTAAPPFRVRKVRTSSELTSFSCMLGGDPGCPAGAEGAPPASAGPGDACFEGRALGKLDVSSDSEEASEVPEWLREGELISVGTNKVGVVRYVGPTDFQEGTWVGVELDLPAGEGCWRRGRGAAGGRGPAVCPEAQKA
ncbi:PREDICTED: kinesin-like protein KIF13B [Condylura cristata]|uniref:kinesin-like protein KIF13B n=1 Tax=Condylura cristata TaxID=143302 RepID=UPI000642C7A9|nr:PREDICTED: kinesin-like protein KIF13B [Condylura cristata]